MAGVSCAFVIVSQPGTDAYLEKPFGTTDADGEVTTTLHAGETTGTIQLEARCGEITVSTSAQVVASPPASLPDTGTGDALAGASRAGVVLGLLLVLVFSLGLPAAYSIHRQGRRQ
ncbi:MAG: hypothetical protein WEB04_03530 [Dehalococcoidia bacterium]